MYSILRQFTSNKNIFLLAFLCVLINCAEGQSKKKILRKARHYADKADFYNSKLEYQKLLKKDSLHKAGNMELGLVLNEYLENPAEAGFYLKRGERACKTDTVPELVYEIGRYYHMTGQFELAKIYFNKLLKYYIATTEGILVRQIVLKDIADCDYAIKNRKNIDYNFI